MKINGVEVDSKNNPLMIAEEGQANQGDLQIAIQMAKHAKDAGADGIEYQLFFADQMYSKKDTGYDIYKKRELKKDEIIKLINVTREMGLIIQVAGLSVEIIELCAENGVDVFVVNATDLNNPEIIDAVINTNKPFWLATLMGTINEIDWAVDYALSKNAANFGLLHGQHVMSTSEGHGVPAHYLQLDCINEMKNRYGLAVGFVDHTATTFVPALAVAKGADCVTKHISPYDGWVGPDSSICLDPKLWSSAREMFRYSYYSGGNSKELSIEELGDKTLFRRSLHLTRALKAGAVLNRSDLISLRPGVGGVDPSKLSDVIGKLINIDLMENQQLKDDYIIKD